jgi:hypothetical protein
LSELDAETGWDANRWAQAWEPYFADHRLVLTGADARGPQLILIDQQPGRWDVRQVIDDPAGDHDWQLVAEIDLAASDERGEPAVRVLDLRRL